MTSRLILVGLVVLALAGLYGAAGLSRPMALTTAAKSGSLGSLPVNSALLACPAPGSAGVTGGGIAEASAPAGTTTGQVALTELTAGAGAKAPTAASTSPHPGQLTIKDVKNAPALSAKTATLPAMAGRQVPTSLARGGLVLSASGSDAQGLDVEQLGPGGHPTGRCQSPGADFWFVAPGSSSLQTSLYLLNPDGQQADADLSVQTDSGPMLGTPDSGIVVPPHSMIVQSLGKILHSAKAIALHVTTSTGRVVAAVRQTTSQNKAGIWLPAAHAPATTQVLTGLPSTGGTRELYITVPGNAPARVKITAVTPRGSYQPTGGSNVPLEGNLTTGIALPSLSGLPGSIKISSSEPVTAVLEITGGPGGAPGAFITGSDPVTEQGVVAASPVGSAGTTEIVLSAPGKAATVTIAHALPGSPLTGQSVQPVQIPAKSAIVVTIKLPKHSPKNATSIALLITPQKGSGPVYAARVALVGATVIDVLPVISSPTRVELPYVRASLVTVLGS
jgi:Family of unknown function (DUF5719)